MKIFLINAQTAQYVNLNLFRKVLKQNFSSNVMNADSLGFNMFMLLGACLQSFVVHSQICITIICPLNSYDYTLDIGL